MGRIGTCGVVPGGPALTYPAPACPAAWTGGGGSGGSDGGGSVGVRGNGGKDGRVCLEADFGTVEIEVGHRQRSRGY